MPKMALLGVLARWVENLLGHMISSRIGMACGFGIRAVLVVEQIDQYAPTLGPRHLIRDECGMLPSAGSHAQLIFTARADFST